ncbi:MAG: hypothetical protein GXY55_01835 [Phycisphaerae bacterium]|nr:hypothetical protein [Phycisphaerae bacterium]
MITVVLEVQRRALRYAWYNGQATRPLAAGQIDRVAVQTAEEATSAMLSAVGESIGQEQSVELIAVRIPFGGKLFAGPTRVGPEVLAKLEDLVPHAPMHLPATVSVLRACLEAFPNVPVVAVFDTSFFADLPNNEALYAVDGELARSLDLRRFGYHGLLHQAACASLSAARVPESARVLSICLEPRPELTAVVDGRPVMVTGGATPLEGLPGERLCGDIDPGIVLSLTQQSGLGLEQINALLTQESGLRGLVGENVKLSEVLTGKSAESQLAAELFKYRLLLAAGAGVAAMGGVDAIVFSGRYHACAEALGSWLVAKLAAACRAGRQQPTWYSFADPVEWVVASQARAAIAS